MIYILYIIIVSYLIAYVYTLFAHFPATFIIGIRKSTELIFESQVKTYEFCFFIQNVPLHYGKKYAHDNFTYANFSKISNSYGYNIMRIMSNILRSSCITLYVWLGRVELYPVK